MTWKICIPVLEPNLDGEISPHFGRAPFFAILEIDVGSKSIKKIEFLDNPNIENHEPGEIPSFLMSQGVNVVLCTRMGRRAMEFFEQNNIMVMSGFSGTVRDAVESFIKEKIKQQ